MIKPWTNGFFFRRTQNGTFCCILDIKSIQSNHSSVHGTLFFSLSYLDLLGVFFWYCWLFDSIILWYCWLFVSIVLLQFDSQSPSQCSTDSFSYLIHIHANPRETKSGMGGVWGKKNFRTQNGAFSYILDIKSV
jgi:hypothetical protein